MSPKVSVSEISKHASPDDCWVVVNGKVYDLTSFAPSHPGGANIIYAWAGRDASKTYNEYHAKNLIENELEDSDKKGDLDESTVTDTWVNARKTEEDKTPDQNERPPLSSIINLNDFEEAFAKSASKKANAYIAGASNDLLTLRANAQHWQKLWFRPRVMKNVSKVQMRTKILGQEVSMPVWIAPMGAGILGGPEAEAALGAGAAASGIIHCMSTVTSLPIEEILATAPGHPWFFQLYVDKQRAKSEALLGKLAGQPQFKALFVTTDLPVVSKREADERIRTVEVRPQYLGGTKGALDSKGGGIARNNGGFIDATFNWDDLAWLKKHTGLPIVLKGIQSVADAKKALEMGCAGIVISNHGGRALDNAPSTVMILLELRRDCPEVLEKMEVFVDGGIRRGSDILKALCLGARGVGVGRPFQCSIQYGHKGVEHCASGESASVLREVTHAKDGDTDSGVVLQDELETAMRLCGVTDVNEVRGDMSFLNTSELEMLLPPEQERYPALQFGWSRIWSKL
ncbi:hypothetical protein DL770_002873 [Monosporascus sp. CRB-9-2]|nr:hypothetical protein DL770_002873 [Monosporascus sp. CRB-9-2]